MLSVRNLVQRIGDPLKAEIVLLKHYTHKQQARHQWDKRYAAMEFVLRWAPLFRRHAGIKVGALR